MIQRFTGDPINVPIRFIDNMNLALFRGEYEEVREQLIQDFNRMRRDRANDALYQGLLEGYEITIDDEALQRMALPGR